MVRDIVALASLFAPACSDRATLDEVVRLANEPRERVHGHDVFDRIRGKTLAAERSGNKALAAQYLFEEVCAGTLYNLSLPRDPFDADTAYWIVPNAFALARRLGIDEKGVLAIVAK